MKARIVSLCPLPIELIQWMVEEAKGTTPIEVEVVNAHSLSHTETLESLKNAGIIIGDFTFKRKIDREMVLAAKGAKLIQQPSVGYQHIDLKACSEAGIPVANVADANAISVAEHAVMVALCLLKRLLLAHQTTTEGQWRQLNIESEEIHGKVWGLIGMGNIGKAIAERIQTFGVTTQYYDPSRLDIEQEKRLRARFTDIDTLFRNADIISLHCPLTDQTRRLVHKSRLMMMKPNAILINVARGEIVDEIALADALKERRIAGAAVDVYSQEPPHGKHPLFVTGSENLILTPHLAGTTNESKGRIIGTAIRNVVKVLSGKPPDYIVNMKRSG